MVDFNIDHTEILKCYVIIANQIFSSVVYDTVNLRLSWSWSPNQDLCHFVVV